MDLLILSIYVYLHMEDTTSSVKALIHHRDRIQAKLCVEWLRRAQQRSQVKAEVPAVACFRCLTNYSVTSWQSHIIYLIYLRLIIYGFVERLGSIRCTDRKYIYNLHII